MKYTISKFEFPTIKIVDFTRAQSWAILPFKMAFESRGKNGTWLQRVTSVCVLEILQHLTDLPPEYFCQKFSINWRNYSIQNHFIFSWSLNFLSMARCKQTWTHKLTSRNDKFGSSLLTNEGKIAQLCGVVKSTIFFVGI